MPAERPAWEFRRTCVECEVETDEERCFVCGKATNIGNLFTYTKIGWGTVGQSPNYDLGEEDE